MCIKHIITYTYIQADRCEIWHIKSEWWVLPVFHLGFPSWKRDESPQHFGGNQTSSSFMLESFASGMCCLGGSRPIMLDYHRLSTTVIQELEEQESFPINLAALQWDYAISICEKHVIIKLPSRVSVFEVNNDFTSLWAPMRGKHRVRCFSFACWSLHLSHLQQDISWYIHFGEAWQEAFYQLHHHRAP